MCPTDLTLMNENFTSNHDVDVFKDHFTCWNRLPMELKVKVIRNLSFPTLRNFMFLSKECMKVSSFLKVSVQFVYLLPWLYGNERMFLQRNASEEQSSASIILSNSSAAELILHEDYTIGFSNRENEGCITLREKKGVPYVMEGPEFPKESSVTVSMRVLFQIMKNLKPETVILELANVADAKITLSKLPSTSVITCGALNVRVPDPSFLPLLMPHVSPGCELWLYNSDPYQNEHNILNPVFFDFEVVKAAPFLDTDAVCEINNGQLIQLKASWLDLKAPGISEKGINGMILQWMKGSRKIIKICISETKTFNYDLVFENVDKNRIRSSFENLQIPFFNKYVEQHPLHKHLALLRNDFDDRLLVNIGEDYCELLDPYSEYMSRIYR